MAMMGRIRKFNKGVIVRLLISNGNGVVIVGKDMSDLRCRIIVRIVDSRYTMG